MNANTTQKNYTSFRYLWLFYLMLLGNYSYAQSNAVYATTVISQEYIDFLANATDGNLSTDARIRASSGIALGVGAYAGHLELEFPQILPAFTTSYVRINTDDNILPSLLGGSLGSLLASVTGMVLLGNQEFTVQVKNGNTVIHQGDSQVNGSLATENIRIVIDEFNNFYIALTPNQSYNRVRLTNRVGSLVGLNTTKRLYVNGVFYMETPEACGGASYTSFDGNGLNLDLLGLGGAGVTNPHHVLDDDLTNFSQLSLGIISVAGSIEQTVYYEGLSEITDHFLIRMRVDPSLLALGVANNIQIIASNDATVVQTANLNSLLNLDLLTLLQGNQQASIPFAPNAEVNRITVRYNALLNVQLTQSLDLYDVIRVPASPSITDTFTLNPSVCAGSFATLIAETNAGYELLWYDQETGGTPLATTDSGEAFITPILQANMSYYVASKKIDCPEESNRITIEVSVTDLPTAADVIIADEMIACDGNIILTPTSTIGGSVFKYYKDQQKSQEITNDYTGDDGVVYNINETTGALSITGLNENDAPYVYFIALEVDQLCENDVDTLKPVSVEYADALILEAMQEVTSCGSFNLRDAIINFDFSSDIQYDFFDESLNPLTVEQASEVVVSGSYFIQVSSVGGDCASEMEEVMVVVNPLPTLEITETNYVVTQGSTFELSASSTGTIIWYDSEGNQLSDNTVGPFTSSGTYSYTAIATLEDCIVSRTIYITAIDTDECPMLTQRVYSDAQSWSSIVSGGVFQANQAVDGDTQTYATITTGLGLLGIGTTWQTLEWDETISAGTPVTLKLGSEYSGLILAGAYSVIGTKRNADGVPIGIGELQPVSGSLVDLLPGENVFEYTFVPSDNTGPKDYDGVRIVVGSLVSIAQSVRVYEAYYQEVVTQLACQSNDVLDVFYGAVDLGVGVATATVGVANATAVVDQDMDTYATMFSGAGILAASELSVLFKSPSFNGDVLQIVLSKPETLLNLNLLTGFSIQLYLNNAPVGDPIDNTSSLLFLTLLNGGTEVMVTVTPELLPFDKVKISFGGVADVLDLLQVHQVKRMSNIKVVDADDDNFIVVCQNDTVHLDVDPNDCASYIWYDALVDGNIVANGSSFTLPSNAASGVHTYYVQSIRYGCPAFERTLVSILIDDNAPADAITQVLINGETDSVFCENVSSLMLEATLNADITITNPVFFWYTISGSDSELIPDENTAQLVLNNLAPGQYTYAVGIKSDEYCETLEADRFIIEFNVLPNATADDILADDILVCINTTAVLTPSTTQENPSFFWYLSNNDTQPITDGLTIDGVTYTITSDGQMSIDGLTSLNSPFTYFVGMTSDESCLNQENDFKQVTVVVIDAGIPTTEDTNQVFCASQNPTLASIQVNETNIIWFDMAIGGNVLPSDTVLTSNEVYYAAFDDTTGCENNDRLAITVIINDIPTPTTTDVNQNFCLSENPVINDIQVNEADIIWYSTASDGEVLNISSALVDGATYYASLLDPITGCESTIRLAITVNINDATTPTTQDQIQVFCVIDNPTIADLQVNESDVFWYDAPSDGNLLSNATALTDNTTYYAAIIDPVLGCESASRLAILVSINNPEAPTTNNNTQTFCFIDNPTIADIQVNESNVLWYDAATLGVVLDATTPLLDGGVYFAALIDPISGCESSDRLAINVSIVNPDIPTTENENQTFCMVDAPTIADIQTNEPSVVWYAESSGGVPLSASTILIDGITYYASYLDPETNCESSERLAVTANIIESETPTTTNTHQSFCFIDNPTVANLQVNESNVVWYTVPTGGTPLATDELLVNGMAYYAAFDDTAICETMTRLAVVVTVIEGVTPTTQNETQVFCFIDNPTIADLQVNESDVLWYDAPSDGNLLSNVTALTDNTTYYAAIIDPVLGCESALRLAILVNISDPESPTTNSNTQTFCFVDNPTIADIQVNESDVVWYDAATLGVVLDATTPLLDGGVYFAALIDPISGCESSDRLAINVSIVDPDVPTTENENQTFCMVDNPTVADIQTNESPVVWYAESSGGVPLSASTILIDGTTYYASYLDPETNCESSERLAVTVNVIESETPTTTNTHQSFCFIDNPTVANLQVNESNVIWYSVPTGGTPLATDDLLVDGTTYYAAFDDTAICETMTRLAVVVTVSEGVTPTTQDETQVFCVIDNPTIADLQVNESDVLWYDAPSDGNLLSNATALTDNTTYYVAIIDPVSGCESVTRLTITVTFAASEEIFITGEDQACFFEEITYETNAGMSDYVWEVINGTIVSGGQLSDNFITILWDSVETGTISVSYDDNCNGLNFWSKEVQLISCSDLSITKTVDNQTPMVGENINFTITISSIGPGSFQDIVVSEVIPSGYTFVSANTSIGSYSHISGLWTIPLLEANQSASLVITLQVLSTGDYLNIAYIEVSTPIDANPDNNFAEEIIYPICLTVYSEFSPNGDGANDTFRIDCIENYPNNKLDVYNRYGVLVYTMRNYNNDWDGTANVSGVINRNEQLPPGTYYYVLDIGENSRVKTGWVSFIR